MWRLGSKLGELGGGFIKCFWLGWNIFLCVESNWFVICYEIIFMFVVIFISVLIKIYDMGVIKVYVLCGVDVFIFENDYVVLMGFFGFGKFILMNLLGCLDIFILGDYLFDGINVSIMIDGELVEVCNWKIGFVF